MSSWDRAPHLPWHVLPWLHWVLLCLLVACLLAWYLTFTASRLDRLHHRVETSRAALDGELTRRASAAVELALSGLLDPAAALVVAGAATASLDAPCGRPPLEPEARRRRRAARSHGPRVHGPGTHELEDEERWRLESGLSKALAAALPGACAAGAAAEDERVHRLLDTVHRVQLARRFHNDAVVQARRLRAERVVRWFRLAGHAPVPRPADFDDRVGVRTAPAPRGRLERPPAPRQGS